MLQNKATLMIKYVNTANLIGITSTWQTIDFYDHSFLQCYNTVIIDTIGEEASQQALNMSFE